MTLFPILAALTLYAAGVVFLTGLIRRAHNGTRIPFRAETKRMDAQEDAQHIRSVPQLVVGRAE